jgi:hypothetical protein
MRRPTARSSVVASAAASPLLPGGGRTAVALGLLTAVWLVTRVVLFMQMHDAAGFEIDALPDFLHRRRTPEPTPLTPSAAAAAGAVKAASVASAGAGSVHVVLTSNGNSYMNWQTRVMYATYLAVVARDPGGAMARGAFTRVLHRSTDDELMVEVPTMRFTPAHVNCDVYCSFPVADRAPALVEWIRTDDAQRCTHVLLVGARTHGRGRACLQICTGVLLRACLCACGSAPFTPVSLVRPRCVCVLRDGLSVCEAARGRAAAQGRPRGGLPLRVRRALSSARARERHPHAHANTPRAALTLRLTPSLFRSPRRARKRTATSCRSTPPSRPSHAASTRRTWAPSPTSRPPATRPCC